MLNAKQAAAELGISARPRLVTLDDKTVEKAREIGCGNVSQGIRTAVEAYTKGENGNIK